MNKKPSIAFVTNHCYHYSLKLFELLAEKYDVHFYFTGSGENYRLKEIEGLVGKFKCFELKNYSLFGRFDFTPGLFKLFFRHYDIYIKTLDGRFAIPLTFFISRIKRVPFIFWTGLWHHPETKFHKQSFKFTKYIYLKSEANVVYGEHIKKYLTGLGVSEKKIFSEHHAVDNNLFGRNIPEGDRKILKSKIGIRNEKVILYVGRFEECKGLRYLVDAIKNIRQVSLCMIFIGSGELKEYLEKECRQNNITAFFPGYVPYTELSNYYSIADVFVLPSITTSDFKEPWGLVVNEAMNQGLPVVASDAVGAAAGGLVLNGECGYIVPEKNSEALCEALTKLLTDEAQRQKMGVNSKKRVLLWNYHQAVEDFAKAIDYVMDKRYA